MFACRLDECPPGLFLHGGTLGFKSEYRTPMGKVEAYVVESGDFFWGGSKTNDDRDVLLVTPVRITNANALSLVSLEENE